MSRFNKPSMMNTKTVNLARGEAFTESPELEFISILLTSFVKDQYYRKTSDTLDRVVKLIDNMKDKTFCAKAALYARREFGMRSISHVVAGELAKSVKGEGWTKQFFDKIVYRVDDMTEILSYYLSKYKKPIPNSLKKGFASAIHRFDAYQLAKYRGEGKAMSLVDVVNLCHPVANDVISKLMKGELKSTETWESKLTSAGQSAKSDEEKSDLKADVWRSLIKERKIGYFALLRNLRNIVDQAPDMIDDACLLLTDRKLIKQSLILPFRFQTALENFGTERKVIQALNKAIDISCDNVPKLSGKTLVVVDDSGSMEGRPIQIAALFAAVLFKSNDSMLMRFSDDASYIVANPDDSTISIANQIIKNMQASGTNFHAIFVAANQPYDRIIILSDMQGWIGYHAPTGSFEHYKSRTNCNPFLYSFDLQGYGSLQFPEPNVFCLAGFSDKVFDIMSLLETDKKALISKINNIEI